MAFSMITTMRVDNAIATAESCFLGGSNTIYI